MRTIALVTSIGCAACWTGTTPAVHSTLTTTAAGEVDTPSYRGETIAADVVGVTVMTAGLVGLHRGANEDMSGALLVTGMAVAGFGDPLLHLAHGRGSRALASYLIRAMATTTGIMVGVATSNCRDELFCGFEGALWGTAGGLAVAGIADALVLHGQLSSHTWTPTVMPSDGGARVGIAAPF